MLFLRFEGENNRYKGTKLSKTRTVSVDYFHEFSVTGTRANVSDTKKLEKPWRLVGMHYHGSGGTHVVELRRYTDKECAEKARLRLISEIDRLCKPAEISMVRDMVMGGWPHAHSRRNHPSFGILDINDVIFDYYNAMDTMDEKLRESQEC